MSGLAGSQTRPKFSTVCGGTMNPCISTGQYDSHDYEDINGPNMLNKLWDIGCCLSLNILHVLDTVTCVKFPVKLFHWQLARAISGGIFCTE